MDHATLIAQHDTIDAAAQVLIALTDRPTPQPTEASRHLGLLAALVRDHLSIEDPIIYATVVATRETRHGGAATLAAGELDELKQDWTHYLYRWDNGAIAADWLGFVEHSRAMLERLRDRVAAETAILYSLAEHYAVIAAGD